MNGSTLYDMTLNATQVLRHYLMKAVEVAPVVLGAIALLVLFGLVGRYAGAWVGKALQRAGAEHHLIRILERTVRYAFISLGIVTFLGTIGVDLTALVATVGLAGFAISFAFQDIIGNFLAGVMVMIQRPFKLGDMVSVAGLEGVVEDIRIRDTVLRLPDGRVSVVPNRNILNGTIVNLTANPIQRLEVEVTVDSNDFPKARELCMSLLRQVQGVRSEPAPTVLITKMSGSTTTLLVRCWADMRERELLAVRSDVLEAIRKGLAEAGIAIK